MTRWFWLTSFATAALACTRPNPAFDVGGEAVETSDSADTLDGQDTTGATSDTDPTDTGTTDTGPSDTGTSDTGTTETGEDPLCTQQPRGSLRLVVNSPLRPCPEAVNEWFVWVTAEGLNVSPGMAIGNQCGDPNCDVSSCSGAVISFGVPELPEVAALWTTLGGRIEEFGAQGLCIEVTALDKLTETNNECTYAALGIDARTGEQGPVFIGQIDQTPRTWVANLVLGAEPLVREHLETCTCEDLFVEKPSERDCCEATQIEPSFDSLSLFGTAVDPGQTASLMIGDASWQFRVVQAQTVPSCDNPEGLTHDTWTLTRGQ